MDELANYSVSLKVEGMKVPGMPAGVGDRDMTFNLKCDPADLEAMNLIWYGHLDALFDDSASGKMKELAKEMTKKL